MPVPDFSQLFYDDFYPPGHLWAFPGQRRVVVWSDQSQIVDGVTVLRLFNSTETALAQQAFSLWDLALDSVEFRYSADPAVAQVLLGWTNEYGTWGHWSAMTGPAGVRDAAAIQLNGLLNFAPEALVHTLLHEIGNVLGLGDIVPSDEFVSVQEDPFPRPFVSAQLSAFDVALIRQLYSEPAWPDGTGVSVARDVITQGAQPAAPEPAPASGGAGTPPPEAGPSGPPAAASAAPPTASQLLRLATPADGAKGVAASSNISMSFSTDVFAGKGAITLKTAAGETVQTFDPKAGDGSMTIFGTALLLNPKADLKAFTSYVVDFGADALEDAAGNDVVLARPFDFRTTAPDGLYQFFVVAFDAAPGAVYMGQLAEAWNAGMSLQDIVEVFTQKEQFTSVFPTTMSTKDFAAKLVDRVVESSVGDTLKTSAAKDIADALESGWSRGKTTYTVFNNLAAKPTTDPDWGLTAQLLRNEVTVARYITEQLQKLIDPVTATSDLSSTDKIVQLIGSLPPPGP